MSILNNKLTRNDIHNVEEFDSSTINANDCYVIGVIGSSHTNKSLLIKDIISHISNGFDEVLTFNINESTTECCGDYILKKDKTCHKNNDIIAPIMERQVAYLQQGKPQPTLLLAINDCSRFRKSKIGHLTTFEHLAQHTKRYNITMIISGQSINSLKYMSHVFCVKLCSYSLRGYKNLFKIFTDEFEDLSACCTIVSKYTERQSVIVLLRMTEATHHSSIKMSHP